MPNVNKESEIFQRVENPLKIQLLKPKLIITWRGWVTTFLGGKVIKILLPECKQKKCQGYNCPSQSMQLGY